MSFIKNLALAIGFAGAAIGLAGAAYTGAVCMNKHNAEKASGRDTFGAKVVVSTWNFKTLVYVIDKKQFGCTLHLEDLVLEDYKCDGTVDSAEGYDLRITKGDNKSKDFEQKANALYNKLVDRYDLKTRAQNYLKEEIDFEKYLNQ